MGESPIEIIRGKLAKYPEVRFRHEDDFAGGIVVIPRDESGFEVGLREDHDGYTVHFDGWHEAFEDRDTALNCFASGSHRPVASAWRCEAL